MLPYFNSSGEDTNNNNQRDIRATEYSIEIYSDEDFTQFSFPGDGSRTNPFIISGYNFSDSILGAIHITNTSKFVEIRDNHLENLYNGIFISKAESGTVTILNNFVSYCPIGVVLNEVDDVDVFHNRFVFCGSYSVLIDQAHSSTVWNNSFEKSEDYAIYISSGSIGNLVYHNDFIDNTLENDEANSQAKDDGRENLWCYEALEDGNYWKDLGDNEVYYIDGIAEAIDYNPHPGPVIIEHEYKGGGLPFSFPSLIIAIISLVTIRVIHKKNRKQSERSRRKK